MPLAHPSWVTLRFTFFGEEQVLRTLDRPKERAQDMRPAWEEIRQRFVAYEQEWFAAEGRGWAPLSRDYARWKRRHFPGQPILRRTDHLVHSLTDGPSINVQEPSFAIFGTDDPVGARHQHGAGRLPVRRVIDLDDQERAEWVHVAQRHLVETGDI